MVTITVAPPASHPVERVVPRCHSHALFVSRDLTVATVECWASGSTELRAFEPDADAIVLVRTGRFGRRLHGSFSLLDSTQAYLHHKGQEELIQHLAGVGHRCTVLSLGSAGYPTVLRLRARLAHTELRTSPRLDLAHRALLAHCRRGGDPATITAMAKTLVDDLVSGWTRPSPASHRTGTAAATRRVVDRALESVNRLVAPPSLRSVATDANVSPQQLARVFKAGTGLTLGQYRSRLRVRLALERLGQGESDLSRLAHDLGYFDHSHFSRTITGELGLSPRQLRELLSDRIE